ncbi:beta/gamma crystallin domain-containing protein [Amycolatopsis sp. QT-25]|uniref:beta/gamma crystallin domain-containing protein n=1 Tax=Amycolatopsis sp. QT-25 TaxID=3034022 RepID=UPI0023EDF729|nr:beta/gamma crystallin domain-containing protein [Amycolatopsis sp. QT-25]WET76366.1 beta/gamma crystallin domain-containing protein [Amycolatopsis sp. QT-25]
MRKSLKRLSVVGAAALGLLVAIPASPAFAIGEVACGDRDDFLKLDISFGNGMGTNRCFANGGVTGTNIGGVYNIFSGNNKATVNYERNGRYESTTLGYRQGVGFPGTVRVYEVRIW